MQMNASKKVAIIGAGPVGLAAAAHVMERGMTPIVLEAGPEAGNSVRQWQHVQLFSPWEYNVDKAAARRFTRPAPNCSKGISSRWRPTPRCGT
jgi:NADPH-dependent 2,4-dienoyl-CoA reductase/sulfur reductase-like enzyme